MTYGTDLMINEAIIHSLLSYLRDLENKGVNNKDLKL